PLNLTGEALTILTSEPRNLRKLSALETITGRRITPQHATPDQIAALLAQHYPEKEQGLRLDDDTPSETPEEQEETSDEVDSAAVHNVNTLIAKALEQRASDIHLETGEGEVTVRYRIDG